MRVLDDNFSLSEDETSDAEEVCISSYLGDSIANLNTALSMSRVVDPNLSFSETILSDFMNSVEDTNVKESYLMVSVVFTSSKVC